jgi:N-acetylglucosamine-6-phosphate deacetylase
MASVGASLVVLPDRVLENAVVEHDGGVITGVRAADNAVPERILCPGFVDIQVNGHEDVDVASARGTDWDRIDGLLLAQGVTAWCPTVVSAPLASLNRAFTRIQEATERTTDHRPHIIGVHLEGPFLGGAPGAHRREVLTDPDLGWLRSMPDLVRLVTLSPEREGALDAVRLLVGRGVVVSLGHSTATYDQAVAAVDAGARLVTHLFNGMGPLHHREPGLPGAALSDTRLCASLIADGVHVHGAVIAAAMAALGDRAVLVTDAVGWRARQHAGFPVELAGDPPAPRLPDGTLAGSALTMPRALKTCVEAGVDLAAAVRAASATPARLLGLTDRGAITAGLRADLVALTPDLRVEQVWLRGREL